ncbi:hypothetical protein [Bartonella grahamii]|uniref:hypothetical protein n=1 Tax=Bartonella grahamii TaxID=33045 RepID=UPI002E7BC443|nr:hypothetical protein [Bartonella grahamii]
MEWCERDVGGRICEWGEVGMERGKCLGVGRGVGNGGGESAYGIKEGGDKRRWCKGMREGMM